MITTVIMIAVPSIFFTLTIICATVAYTRDKSGETEIEWRTDKESINGDSMNFMVNGNLIG